MPYMGDKIEKKCLRIISALDVDSAYDKLQRVYGVRRNMYIYDVEIAAAIE